MIDYPYKSLGETPPPPHPQIIIRQPSAVVIWII